MGGLERLVNSNFEMGFQTGSWLLTIPVRSILLSLLVVSSVMTNATSVVSSKSGTDTGALEIFPLLLHDLKTASLFKVGDKSLFVNGEDDIALRTLQVSSENEPIWVSETDGEMQNSISKESIDSAFIYSSHFSIEFIDRTLKVGGILVIQVYDNPNLSFRKPENYEVIRLGQFDSEVLVMRKKTGFAEERSMFAKRKLLWSESEDEAKKKALNKLEDVLLEPPRAASRKSRTYAKRTRYLPDIMGDSLHLESYPRRVFIDVGLPEREGGSGTNWFAKNYPTRNLEFEMYKIETVNEEFSGKEVVPKMEMSDWLRENVKEDEYVVMKAEAEVVEEMVKKKDVIRVVDELFLECKPKGLEIGGRKGLSKHDNNSKRAYWECLALYGKLRDEGVAVHQWWG